MNKNLNKHFPNNLLDDCTQQYWKFFLENVQGNFCEEKRLLQINTIMVIAPH